MTILLQLQIQPAPTLSFDSIYLEYNAEHTDFSRL